MDDIDEMNEYMNRVTQYTFSHFDTGKGITGRELERFYHGFVLGLLIHFSLNPQFFFISI